MSDATRQRPTLRPNVGSTPIPPSLQSKMAAFASRAAATAAQNASPSSNVPNGGLSVEAATAALARASLDSPSPSQPQPMNRPPLKMPGQSGMAARRQRNPLSLRDIDSGLLFDGPAAAGLGAGRPIALPPRKPPPSFNSTPFSNFSKIVYVSVPS